MLVDSFGSPTAAEDVNFFAQTFGMPTPDFEQVFAGGKPGSTRQGHRQRPGSGQNGPSSAEGWATEANLDVQWAYAMAPKAHIVLLATNTAETQGVPGLPAAMKAIDSAIDTYPAGTVFSMSFGTDESAFAGAAAQQFAKFDQTFKKGLAKGDTFLSSSGDNGSVGVIRAHRASATSDRPAGELPQRLAVRHLGRRNSAPVQLDVAPDRSRRADRGERLSHAGLVGMGSGRQL